MSEREAMPTLFLKHRQPELRERMDDPNCDEKQLFRTYDQFKYVNPFIAGWHRIYRQRLRSKLPAGGATLLDIGCGGADVVSRIARWAQKDGINLQITAIEPDVRAIRYLETRSLSDNISIRQAFTHSLVEEGRNFDVVISNHIIHHLSPDELDGLLSDSEKLTTRVAIHNDIRRDDLAYAGFAPTRLLFRQSFITEDGLTSIRRSYLPRELRKVVPSNWQVEPMALFRNLLIWEP